MASKDEKTFSTGKHKGEPRCMESIYNGYTFHQCDKVAVAVSERGLDAGKAICKFHKSVETRVQVRRDKDAREWELRRRREAEAKSFVAFAKDVLGIDIGIHYAGYTADVTQVVVPSDFIREVIRAKQEGDWR